MQNFNPNYANICKFALGLRPKPHILDHQKDELKYGKNLKRALPLGTPIK
jgi:hypothetical protein